MNIQKLKALFTDENPDIIKARKWIAGLLFLALFVFLGFSLDWSEIWEILRTVDPILLGASYLLAFPYHLLVALTFKLITDQHDFGLSVGRIIWINLTILFYVIVLPASVVGSGMRLYRYAKYSNKPVEAFAAITYHKIFMNVIVILMSLCFLIFASVEQVQESYALLGGMLLVLFAILLLIPRVSMLILRKIRQPEEQGENQSLFSFVLKYAVKMLKSFAEIGQMSLKDQFQLSTLGLLAQMLRLGSYLLIARSIGVQTAFEQLGMVFTLVFLANNLPFNFSLGIGLREISLGALLIAIGVAPAYAVAMPLVLFSRAVFIGLVGGILEGLALIRKKK